MDGARRYSPTTPYASVAPDCCSVATTPGWTATAMMGVSDVRGGRCFFVNSRMNRILRFQHDGIPTKAEV